MVGLAGTILIDEDVRSCSSIDGRVAQRLAQGAARNTIRYEVGVLSAAFGVAVELDKLTVKPAFKQIEGGAVRTGFFEPGKFAALMLELPAELADLVRFLYMTGWRRGEVAGLTVAVEMQEIS